MLKFKLSAGQMYGAFQNWIFLDLDLHVIPRASAPQRRPYSSSAKQGAE